MHQGIMATLLIKRMRWEETNQGRACGAEVMHLDPVEALLQPPLPDDDEVVSEDEFMPLGAEKCDA